MDIKTFDAEDWAYTLTILPAEYRDWIAIQISYEDTDGLRRGMSNLYPPEQARSIAKWLIALADKLEGKAE